MTTTEPHPALAHPCPFCGADAGQECTTRTGKGLNQWCHSRRIELTLADEERQQRVPKQVNALCCECGQVRTVSDHHRKRDDPNAGWGSLGASKGWQHTQSLKCEVCGGQTRHAVLRPADCSYRDSDEHWQGIALGDPDTSRYGHLTDLERVRREYREKSPFPRNPNLRHRYYVAAATKAWDEGHGKVIALCGEPDTIETDPRTWGEPSKKNRAKYNGYVVAEQLSDIEYSDLETGLEWLDMDCVDCCRVSNRIRRENQRTRLHYLLARLATSPELIPDDAVDGLVAMLEQYGNEPT